MLNQILTGLIQLLATLFCIFGFGSFFRRKLKIDVEFSGILAVSFISVFLIITGLTGDSISTSLLFYSTVLLYITGMTLFVISIIKDEFIESKSELIYYLMIIFVLLIFNVTVIGAKQVMYDAFSHWALVVRLMHTTSAIPTAVDISISFVDYPLGVSIFVYFSSIIGKYTPALYQQANAIILVFSISVILPISRMVKTKDKIAKIILSVLFVVVVCFAETFSMRSFTMYVDTMLSLVAFSLTSLVFKYKEDLRRITIPFIIMGSFLVSIKHSAVIFLVFSLFLYFIYTLKYRKFSIGMIGAIALPFAYSFAWKNHCKNAFINLDTSKHSVSTNRYMEEFLSKGDDGVNLIINKFSDVNMHDFYWILLAILLIVSLIFFISKKSEFFRGLFFLTLFLIVTSILYQLGNLAMYLYSMPMFEAKELAGYYRYFDSIKLYAYLLIIRYFLLNFIDMKKYYKIGILVVVIIYSAMNFKIYKKFVTPVNSITKKNIFYGMEEEFNNFLVKNGIYAPRDTINKRICIVSKKGYDYTDFLVYKYVTLSSNINIIKMEDIKGEMRYDYIFNFEFNR